MFETHFGLEKRPFRALAQGNDVFVGPQTAAAVAGIKKALTASDSVVAITGITGIGKTTLVGRALDELGENLVRIPVGRIKLAHDEVLELLLGELGVENIPPGTVQRFTRFRRKLKELTDQGSRVAVLVEDAAHIGVDGLSELEALTAADAGVSEGAAVVIMGDPETDELLKVPALARLRQRLRWTRRIEPFSDQELLGYFAHCFSAAGGEFASIFSADSSPLLHALSEGVPRIANKVVEASMAAAADKKQQRVSVELIREIARNECGVEADVPTVATPAAAAAPPAETPAPPQPGSPGTVENLPELIQDTLPDLEVLAPQLATVEKEVPEWEREPTLAQLKPDLEALEHAMAVAHGAEKDTEVSDDVDPPVLMPEKEQPAILPEITLDDQIKAKIKEDAEELKRIEAETKAKAEADKEAAQTIDIAATGEIAIADLPLLPDATEPEPAAEPESAAPEPEPTPEPEPEPEPVPEPEPEAESGRSDSEILEIAENLSKAKSIDDVDDKMAETLFGEEFSAIAAQVAKKAAAELPANDELELEEDVQAEKSAPANGTNGIAAVSASPNANPIVPSPALDKAASERLATVRALNGAPNVAPPPPPSAESVVMREAPQLPQPPAASQRPDSIEDQFTSMTQTLRELKMPAAGFDDDDDEEKKGFFGRFRK